MKGFYVDMVIYIVKEGYYGDEEFVAAFDSRKRAELWIKFEAQRRYAIANDASLSLQKFINWFSILELPYYEMFITKQKLYDIFVKYYLFEHVDFDNLTAVVDLFMVYLGIVSLSDVSMNYCWREDLEIHNLGVVN